MDVRGVKVRTQRCLNGVGVMFLGYLTEGALRAGLELYRGFLRAVSGMSKGCLRGVSQRCVSEVSQGCLRGDPGTSEWCLRVAPGGRGTDV